MNKRFFSLPKRPCRFGGPPGLLFSEQRVFFPGVRGCPGHEVNQLSASSTKFKNEWSYSSTHPVFIHGAESENFAPPTFLIYLVFLLVFHLSFVSSRLSFRLPCFFINSLVFYFCLSSSLVYLFLYFCISISSSSLRRYRCGS